MFPGDDFWPTSRSRIAGKPPDMTRYLIYDKRTTSEWRIGRNSLELELAFWGKG